GERDAARRDGYQPEYTAEPELAILRATASPVGVPEGDEDPADQPADVASPGDAGEGEADHEVDHDPRHRVPREPACDLPLEDHHRPEDPEDRPRRADCDPGRLQQRPGRAGEPGHEVEAEVALRAEVLLDGPADQVEGDHVEGDVDHGGVEEHRRHEPPPAPVVD